MGQKKVTSQAEPGPELYRRQQSCTAKDAPPYSSQPQPPPDRRGRGRPRKATPTHSSQPQPPPHGRGRGRPRKDARTPTGPLNGPPSPAPRLQPHRACRNTPSPKKQWAATLEGVPAHPPRKTAKAKDFDGVPPNPKAPGFSSMVSRVRPHHYQPLMCGKAGC